MLALHQAGAPQQLLRRIVDYLRTKQLPDGGWSWNASPGATADTDMTGSVVAAFCAAGVSPGDPDLNEALDLLHTLQDPATGGFIAPPASFGIGVNTDTTSWVVSGLIQCGIDPQGPEWTTAQGKTPLDYLVSMQRPDGHFDWTGEYRRRRLRDVRLGAAAGRGRLLDRAAGAARRVQPGGPTGRRRCRTGPLSRSRW